MMLNWLTSFWLLLATVFISSDTPSFKGGQKNLDAFISRSIIYPEYSRQNCLQGTVQVSFQLNKAGRIVDSKIEKGFGTDLDDEALRIIRLTSGRWLVPSSFDTTQYLTLPINFSLREYNCDERTSDDIREAIATYKAREDLTNAITNYYAKRSAGKPAGSEEQHILNLKEQLGYNERFIDRMIRQAQQKLKQGDRESACEDLNFVKNLGSNKADKLLEERCN
ncbi:energy transducer TonB [Pedobacter sp. SYSU D00535]|uniref:energy transducer TonB n=1 Tax=Pedobacter sp. SYSU D00535 TaxID=2810308 RepID=UPI001A95D152|nr:TonB family protein [Pedobacter sp. SYSU D00535]